MAKAGLSRAWIGVILAAASAASSPSAVAQDKFLDAINRRAGEVPKERRSDLILLPALAKMDTPPENASDAFPFMLVDETVGSRWSKLRTWAQAAPQRAALDALEKATVPAKGGEPPMAFALPYGLVSEAREASKLGLHIDLTEDPTISAARVQYLPRLLWLIDLTHVEATRLTAEGKPMEAITLLLRATSLGRQMAERELSQEVQLGLATMARGLMRIRDVAYVDFKGKRALTPENIKEVLGKLGEETLLLERIRFPEGDKEGIAQLIARVYGTGEFADAARVGPTLAKMGASQHPLTMFQESAKWESAGQKLAPRGAMEGQLTEVYGDWESKWKLDLFDKLLQTPWSYERVRSRPSFAVVGMLPDLSILFEIRTRLRVEAVGTRTALGLMGYTLVNKNFPRTVTSARPEWLKDKEGDPLNPAERDRRGVAPLRYLRAETEDTQNRPLEMNVITETGANFDRQIFKEDFVIYSVGSDNQDNRASTIQNTAMVVRGADYLVWPPLVTLMRQHLKDAGQLK